MIEQSEVKLCKGRLDQHPCRRGHPSTVIHSGMAFYTAAGCISVHLQYKHKSFAFVLHSEHQVMSIAGVQPTAPMLCDPCLVIVLDDGFWVVSKKQLYPPPRPYCWFAAQVGRYRLELGV